jgi:sugar lactone lactonase YvrE
VDEPALLIADIAFGESPRWHDGRLWFCDWAAEEVIAVDLSGRREVIGRVRSFPFSIDWLPDGRPLVVSARDQAVLVLGPEGALSRYADLSGLSPRPPGNEIVIDRLGNTYVNGGGFDMMAGEDFAPGMVALVTPDGDARIVATGLAFPNGMAISDDGRTLMVAESYGRRLTAFEIGADGDLTGRRVWADLGDGTPDGICLDAEGAVWYADVPNRRCVRVREGGEVLATVEHDRGCFACMLGGPDGRTLFIVAREWRGLAGTDTAERTGQVLTVDVDVAHAGRP